MTRRGFGQVWIAGLMAMLVAAPACLQTTPQAGPDAMHTIAFLRVVPTEGRVEREVLGELRRAGFAVGENLRVHGGDVSQAHPDPEEAEATVRRWARRQLDLVVAQSSSGAAAAARGAPGAHVLFISNDPAAAGLVGDEDRPEGQLTGVTFRVPLDRTLDLARRAIPDLRRVGLVYPPDDPAGLPNRDAVAAAADLLGLELLTEAFTEEADIAPAVEGVSRAGAQVLLMSTSPVATRYREAFGTAASARGLPIVANTDVIPGAVVALYAHSPSLGRQLGRQAARLLQGADPSAVPVEDPRRFEMLVDVGAAARLGIELPPDLVREADVVRGSDGP